MTAILAEIDGMEYVLRNILKFDVSYSEEKRSYKNESGRMILYPVRTGKRSISLTIEANTIYLDVLRKLFAPTEIHLRYMDGMEADTDCIGNIRHRIQEGIFYKSSDISIRRAADSRVALNNAGIHCSYGKLGAYDRFGRGAYEFSVTLEEV
ncbi:MAG: hypothetical protein ACI4JQ_04600 [Ruminococcus sp.]